MRPRANTRREGHGDGPTAGIPGLSGRDRRRARRSPKAGPNEYVQSRAGAYANRVNPSAVDAYAVVDGQGADHRSGELCQLPVPRGRVVRDGERLKGIWRRINSSKRGTVKST
jgi:hypothetical protein